VKKKCNGKRDQTGFVDIKQFDESVLKSDYHFLHNIVRESDSANRDLRATKRRKIRGRVSEFKKKCEERGIRIKIMPSAMNRRQVNTSHYDRKRDKVKWHIEWIFQSALDGELRVSNKNVDEDTTLNDAIQSNLSRKWPGKASTQYRLKHYVSGAYTILMRNQTCNRNGKPVYSKVEPSARLCDVLKGREVVEFPEFLVVLGIDTSMYQLRSTSSSDEVVVVSDNNEEELMAMVEKGDDDDSNVVEKK